MRELAVRDIVYHRIDKAWWAGRVTHILQPGMLPADVGVNKDADKPVDITSYIVRMTATIYRGRWYKSRWVKTHWWCNNRFGGTLPSFLRPVDKVGPTLPGDEGFCPVLDITQADIILHLHNKRQQREMGDQASVSSMAFDAATTQGEEAP